MYQGKEVGRDYLKWNYTGILSGIQSSLFLTCFLSPHPHHFFKYIFFNVQYPSMVVVFQAQKWAESRDGTHQGSKVLLFDILLEENVLGIPVSALPLVVTAVIVVAVR